MGELSDSAAGTMANAAGRRDAARHAGLVDRTAKRVLDVVVSALLLAVLRSRSPSARSQSSSKVADRSSIARRARGTRAGRSGSSSSGRWWTAQPAMR